MKQSSGSGFTMLSPSPSESEVVDILLNLTSLVSESERGRGFPFMWGRKKKRSAINVTPSESPSPPPLKAKAPSPATPLSFSPSESDENPRRNVSLKRKREHYLKILEELSKDNNLLYGEIKNVRNYFDHLKDFNLKLKARKQKLSLDPNLEDLVQKQQQLQFPGTVQPLPLIVNQTVGTPQIRDGVCVGEASGQETTSLGVVASSSGSGLGMVNNTTNSYDMGPIGIPDLNVPLEESCEALDVNVDMANKNLSRVMAAQARQNRLQICRVKNPIGNTKTRYSFR